MEVYITKAKIIPGANFKEVEKIALKIFRFGLMPFLGGYLSKVGFAR